MLQASSSSLPRGFSARLRQETHAQHDRIEANARFQRLMAPDLTREEYRRLLGRLYGFHVVAEARVAEVAGHFPPALALDRRLRRTALMAEDLQALGVSAATLPRCAMPPCDRAEQAWGVLYLLEGSALGGQIIARHLATALGITAANGAASMAPYGTDTGDLWRGFKQTLDIEAGRGALDGDAVIAVAQAAFGALDDWMAAA